MGPLDFLHEPAWRPLTWTLLHFVWQGALVAGVWAVLFRLFQSRSTQARYLLGLAGMLAVAACPVATLVYLESSIGWDKANLELASAAARPVAEAPGAVPLPKFHPGAARPLPSAGWDASLWKAELIRWTGSAQPYVLGGWIAGLMLLSGRLLLGVVGVWRLGRGRHGISGPMADRAAALAARMGFKKLPGVFASAVACEAVVTGFLRPIILLPAAWLAEMTPEVLEAVIAHELAHIRRFDLWVNLFQRVVETLLFYHPVVWWLSHRVRLAREMCCDEMAAAATGDRVVYATALEFAAQRRLLPTRPLLQVALGATRMTLLTRVRNVLGLPDGENKGRWLPMLVLGLLVLLAVCFAMAIVGRAKYTASSYLRIALQQEKIAFANDNSALALASFDLYKSTHQQLVTSRLPLTAALRKPAVANLAVIRHESDYGDPVAWLQRRLQVSFPGRAELMEVSLSSDDPEEAAILVNAVVDAYLTEVVNAERISKRERLSELDRACGDKETDIRNKREDLKKLVERLGTSDTETLNMKQKIVIEELSLLRQNLARGQFEVQRLHGDLAGQQALLKNIESIDIDDPDVDVAVQHDPIARHLLLALDQTELNHPDRTTRQKEFDARRTQLLEIARKKKRATVNAEIQKLDATMAVLEEQQKAAVKDVDRMRWEAEKFGNSTVDIEMMKADIKNSEIVLTGISNERDKLKVEVRSPSRVTLIQKAEAPRVPQK